MRCVIWQCCIQTNEINNDRYETDTWIYIFSTHLSMSYLVCGHIPYYVLHNGDARMEEGRL